MIDKFQFHMTSGTAHPAVKDLDWLKDLGWPMEFNAASKLYDTSDECINECVHFLNRQSAQIQNNVRTIFEPNPFLAGHDMDEEKLAYEKARWARDEIFKVHAANPNQPEPRVPITCSIFKVHMPTGFEVEGNETKH